MLTKMKKTAKTARTTQSSLIENSSYDTVSRDTILCYCPSPVLEDTRLSVEDFSPALVLEPRISRLERLCFETDGFSSIHLRARGE
jgi:hypothetical protein